VGQDPFEERLFSTWTRLCGDVFSAVVGFSGGADSTALIFALSRLKKRFSSFSLVVYHLNHSLRETAPRDEEFCRTRCEALGFSFVSESRDVKRFALENGYSIEEAGRILRYEGFERLRKQHNLEWIVLAHHGDDQVETFFLRLFRGGGIESLAVMEEKQGYVVRPLLGFSRREIEDYLTRWGQSWCEDESNKDIAYDRNYLRWVVLPSVERRFPAFREKVVEFVSFLKEVSPLLEWHTKPLEESVEFFHGGWRIPRKIIREWGLFWVREVVRRLWRREMPFVRGSWLEAICDYDDRETRMLLSTREGQLWLDGEWLTWVNSLKWPLFSECVLLAGGEILCGPWRVFWREFEEKPSFFPRAEKNCFFVPCGLGELVVREVRAGDRIALRSGHKKVHDLWVDNKMPWLERRWSVVFTTREGEIVAVYLPSVGVRVSHAFYLEERMPPPYACVVIELV